MNQKSGKWAIFLFSDAHGMKKFPTAGPLGRAMLLSWFKGRNLFIDSSIEDRNAVVSMETTRTVFRARINKLSLAYFGFLFG
jgi:hypothetical protein